MIDWAPFVTALVESVVCDPATLLVALPELFSTTALFGATLMLALEPVPVGTTLELHQ